MDHGIERRRERRLRYHWPVWFAEDFDGELTQGQMVDVSSGGAAFSCYSDCNVYTGQRLTARFSVPDISVDGVFEMAGFTRSGTVCRVEQTTADLRRVAVQFAQVLTFKPGEQAKSEEDEKSRLSLVTI